MTATPIPRTLAITVYGGMDISVIDELPPGRQPVKTRRVTPAKVERLCTPTSAEQARKGFQTYIVCPLVEESDKRALTSVVHHFEELSAGPFSRTSHGAPPRASRPSRRRTRSCAVSSEGELDVLFTTTVIEVGIDCP
ncbi:MAG: hypothetical protein ACOX5J_09685 [Candidatus Hydrogenedentales bacterium]